MKILSLSLKYGTQLCSRRINFSEGVNLVYSDANTRGKTTLLRILLYACGFDVPNMKGISFADIQYQIEGINDKNDKFSFSRNISENGYACRFTTKDFDKEYVQDQGERLPLKQYLFGHISDAILENLLGVFYLDQEKGWNLLNRGKVIGNIRIGIEELLCGLNNVSLDEIKGKIAKVTEDLQQYQKLFSFASFSHEVKEEMGDIQYSSVVKKLLHSRALADVQLKQLKDERHHLQDLIKGNLTIKDMIDNLRLVVRLPNGDEFPISHENIVGFDDNISYLESRARMLSNKIADVSKERESISDEISIYNNEYDDGDLLKEYKARIIKLGLSQLDIQAAMESLKAKLSEYRKELREQSHNEWANAASRWVIHYLELMKAKHNYSYSSNPILTASLSPFSGAELSKRVLAFRFALIKCINEAFGLNLPIIIDSPYAKEIDGDNFTSMLQVLHNDFSEHQIIIASIHDEGMFDKFTKIKLYDGVFDSPVTYEFYPVGYMAK